MAPRIHLLPAALADQIAAGEVVERPSSVVKELVENAIDAGARRVEVEIERGGLERIVVSDDGEGMSVEDAHLALRRHATSKLRAADELFALGTFGFRGEALPSIASISELHLTTRQPAHTAGYALVVRSGEVLSAQEVGAPPGTRVDVRALFANVPARLKFQKGVATEAGHVLDVLGRMALCAPRVHVRLRVDGRVVLELPPHGGLSERAQAILRRTAGRSAKLATTSLQEGPITVEVTLAPPEESVQSARRVHLLVNRRWVRDRGILAAIQVGLGELLPRGRHPLAVISLSLPPADVDVNVHPQKAEVRLARPAEAYAAVRHAVARAAAEAGFAPVRNEPEPQPEAEPEPDLFPRAAQHRYSAEPSVPLFARDDEDGGALAYGPERGRAYELVRAMAEEAGPPPPIEPVAPIPPPRFLGAVPGGYLAFAERVGLVLIDQHVADALLRATRGLDPVRRPIAPLPAPALTPEETAALLALGFVTREASIVEAPAWVAAPGEVFVELLAALRDGGEDEAYERAVTLAARSPADPIAEPEASALYAELRALADEGALPPLDQAHWRGRRARLVLLRSEISARLET